MDGIGLHGLQRLRGVSVPRVLRRVLRPGAQGSPRRGLGHTPGRDAAQLPQLGPPGAKTDLFGPPLRKGCVMALLPTRVSERVRIDVHLDADAGRRMADDVRTGLLM